MMEIQNSFVLMHLQYKHQPYVALGPPATLRPSTDYFMDRSIIPSLTLSVRIHNSQFPQSTTEAIGQSAANALGSTIQSTYREAFRTSVVPAFESSCQSLFMQVNSSFEAGTRQCKWHILSDSRNLRCTHFSWLSQCWRRVHHGSLQVHHKPFYLKSSHGLLIWILTTKAFLCHCSSHYVWLFFEKRTCEGICALTVGLTDAFYYKSLFSRCPKYTDKLKSPPVKKKYSCCWRTWTVHT